MTPLQQLNDPAWAWAPCRPDAAYPWGLREAGHLYRRAAFGGTWTELQQAVAEGPQRTIDKLMHPTADVAGLNRTYDDYERDAARSSGAEALRAWWLRRLVKTPDPLHEQVTLFWHNHFALSMDRVNDPVLMCRYLQVLRRGAMGNFHELLADLTREPAFFTGLAARANRKARPNLHLARTLIEQYTVGPRQFTEKDVAETARAFTGWFVPRQQLRYLSHEHDSGPKQLLGQEGDFDGQAVVRILSSQPATARWLVRRLYRWFISETSEPTDQLIAPLVSKFSQDGQISPLVETMVRSNLFFSPLAYRQKIKTPVEFAVGIVRPLEGTVGTLRLGADLAGLGQDLCAPPTTKGWTGNRCWTNRFTLAGRARLAQALVAGQGPYEGKLDPSAVAAKNGQKGPDSAGQFLLGLFLQNDLAEEARERLLAAVSPAGGGAGGSPPESLRQLAGLAACLPEFHLA